MKSSYIHYFVEGETEQKLINVLKTQLKKIKTGKVQKLNVINEKITDAMLRILKKNTVAVLVFDTDTKSVEILNYNIKKIRSCKSVSKIVTIPQVPNLEAELIKSCHLKKITDLLSSTTAKEFKSDFLRVSNLDTKLLEHGFDIDLLWCTQPPAPYQNIANQAEEIKLH